MTETARPQLRRLHTRSDEETAYAWKTPAQLDPIDPPAPYPIQYEADEVAPDVYPDAYYRPSERSGIDWPVAIFWVVLVGGWFVAAILAYWWVAK